MLIEHKKERKKYPNKFWIAVKFLKVFHKIRKTVMEKILNYF